MTIETVTHHPAVVRELGKPIVDATVFPMGGVNIHNGAGDANFIVKVRGPKGEADVTSRAVRENGQWRLTYLHVSFRTNKPSITLIDDNGAAGDLQRPMPLQEEGPASDEAQTSEEI